MKVVKNIIIILVLSMTLPIAVNAATYDFSLYSTRKSYNEKKYAAADRITEKELIMYQDIFLKDMYETNYKGMTEEQQQKIEELKEEILSDPDYTCEETDTEEICKVRKFHDWIKTNFYYYDPGNDTNAKKLGLNIDEYDNPYYILTKNKITTSEGTHYVSRCNGYTAMLIALTRSENITARAISGYYNTSYRRLSGQRWMKDGKPFNIAENTLKHSWVEAYIDNEWVVMDANADSYNSYAATKKCNYQSDGELNGNGLPSEYKTKTSCENAGYSWTNWIVSQKSWADAFNNKYFNISVEDLSDSHIIFLFRSGSRELQYLFNEYEMSRLTTFLNKKTSGKTNGQRVNSNYDPLLPNTWFTTPTQSAGDGYGRMYKLYWPENRGLWGKLTLSEFKSLQNVYIPSNRLTSIYLEKCPKLSTVSVSSNQLIKLVESGSKNITLISAINNPLTSATYQFGTPLKTATITSTTGGTFSMRYKKVNGKHTHEFIAKPKSGYKFKGWYKGTTRLTRNLTFKVTKCASFTYKAKFIKK